MFDNSLEHVALKAEANKAAPLEGLGTVLHRTKNVMKVVYDFSVLGGALGDINLLDDAGNDAILPSGAIVTNVLAYVVTSVTSSAAATVACKLLNAADMMVATAKGSLTAGTFVDGVPASTAATVKGPVTNAAGTQLKATVGTTALTAGKIYWFVEYVIK